MNFPAKWVGISLKILANFFFTFGIIPHFDLNGGGGVGGYGHLIRAEGGYKFSNWCYLGLKLYRGATNGTTNQEGSLFDSRQ